MNIGSLVIKYVELRLMFMAEDNYLEEWEELEEKLTELIKKRIEKSFENLNNTKLNLLNLYLACFTRGLYHYSYVFRLITEYGNCYKYLDLDKAESELYLNDLVYEDLCIIANSKDELYDIYTETIKDNMEKYKKKIEELEAK